MNGWERALSLAAGATAIAVGLRQHGSKRILATTAGAGLVARGFAGYCPVNAAAGRGRDLDDTRAALGGRRGLLIKESVDVDAPADRLFAFWRDPANLTLLPGVHDVEVLDESHWHWTVAGPAKTRLEWDAEIINEVQNELIGWRSLEGADVASAGSVTFRPRRNGGTRVTVTLQYNPPAGRLGAAVSTLLGRSPARDVRRALKRWRDLMEENVPTPTRLEPWAAVVERSAPASPPLLRH